MKTMRWRKSGLVFRPKEYPRPWMDAFAQAPASLVFDDFVRIYFSTRPAPDENGQFVSYSAWADFDRNDLTRCLRVAEEPILSLGDRGCFDESGIYPVSVIRLEDRIRAYYAGWTRCSSVPFDVCIGMADSFDDGKTFQRIGPGPVLSAAPQEPFVISGPKIRFFKGQFYLFYIAGTCWKPVEGKMEPVYTIRFATSKNGLDWQRSGRSIIAPRLEADEAQASPDVWFDGENYHMLFCYRYSSGFRGPVRGYRIGYAWSNDLETWHRDDEKAGLNVSESGFDNEMTAYPHVLQLDGKTYLYYLGNHVGREGFGLAQLENFP